MSLSTHYIFYKYLSLRRRCCCNSESTSKTFPWTDIPEYKNKNKRYLLTAITGNFPRSKNKTKIATKVHTFWLSVIYQNEKKNIQPLTSISGICSKSDYKQ